MTITSLHCAVHEASLLLAVRACFHIHLISKNLINKTTAKAALTQIISVTNQRMESNDALRQAAEAAAGLATGDNSAEASGVAPTDSAVDQSNGEAVTATAASIASPTAASNGTTTSATTTTSTTGASLVFSSVYHKDAYLLFRALCKLSMKGLSDETQYAHSDAIPLQNK